MSTVSNTAQLRRSTTGIGAACAVVAAALTAYGAHDWGEIVVVTIVIAAVSALVFGLVVPRALRRERAGGTGLTLSILAALLVLPAFWSGLPLVLGVGGILVGDAGRNSQRRAGTSIAALAIGTLAVLAYFGTYGYEMVNGVAGFLFD